jgi:hypothetical protein
MSSVKNSVESRTAKTLSMTGLFMGFPAIRGLPKWLLHVAAVYATQISGKPLIGGGGLMEAGYQG